ncbi:MAG TPA: ABC transporter ATP-binding protein [Turneriella sp.]|nr:ABC transporter ATP-binding protein [Turneriella sp.]HNJ65414.1 ABC transporter ATP-binding protein [Turneriella sp.]HNL54443.1 ABC transporter ATP-binding protein [Turneriella sp.]HNN00082.1 ABC transporter ATP-binding protein [Turneriella sp.]
MSNPIISLQDIRFAYGKRTILDGISLDFTPGSFSVIAGESGSGKSTLLYILGGFLKPDGGTYLFNGKPVYRRLGEFGLGRFRKNNIGFLFQDFRLLPFLTVEQNIRFPSLFSGAALDKARLAERMQRLGIAHRAKAYPNSVSGGEAQRTGLARALLMDPPVLLLDEPTGNLDSATEVAIVSVLEDLRNEGLTLICISHSEYIMKRADRVLRLSNGQFSDSMKAAPKKRRKTGGAEA